MKIIWVKAEVKVRNYNMCLYNFLNAHRGKHYMDLQIVKEGHNVNVSYNDLLLKVDEISTKLQQYKIYNLTVALAVNNSIDFIIYLLALNKNHCTVFLQNVYLNKLQDNMLVNLKKLKINLLIQKEHDSVLEESGIKVITLRDINDVNIKKQCVIRSEKKWRDAENIIIQHSSGTTGDFKFAFRSCRNIIADVENINYVLNYTLEDRIVILSSMAHGYGLTMGLLAGLYRAVNLIVEPYMLVNRVYKHMTSNETTVIIGIPLIYDLFIDYNKKQYKRIPKTMKYLLCSGDKLEKKQIDDFYTITNRFINQVYGMMEVSTISINKSVTEKNKYSVGEFIPGMEYTIQDTTLYLKSNTISVEIYGEYNNLDSRGEWFCTGDSVIIEENNQVYFIKRQKK